MTDAGSQAGVPSGNPAGSGKARADVYQRLSDENRVIADEAGRRRNVLSWVRLIVFLVMATAVYRAFASPAERLPGAIAALVLLAAFVYLVKHQRRAEETRTRASDLVKLNGEAMARLRRDWSALPLPLSSIALAASPTAIDLTLTGRGSLLQLLGTIRSAEGRLILGAWLLAEPSPEEIAGRQAAVQELAPMLELRQEIERLAMRTPQKPGALEPFHGWAVTGSWLLEKRWLLTLARALAVITILLIVLYVTGVVATPLWLAVMPVNALLWLATAPRAGGELGHLEMRAGDLDRFASIFALISAGSFRAPLLVELQSRLRSEARSAEHWLRRLARIVEYAEVRNAHLLYIPLQFVTIWDLHLINLIDRWREQVGSRTRGWLGAVGEIEALSALAALSYDNPDWSFPTVEAGGATWKAQGLAHPLIAGEKRVRNDVELGPAGRFLLVTGSNMSGKSTLMRAVGVNVVLAQAGGPVCAAEMRMPVTRLGTAFVIEDSLEDGVSYFMAELRRLKEIVDEAAGAGKSSSRYLFLLDEILKGTNSGERQIAVRRILQELLESGASGAITTHDLALAEVEELSERSIAVHFTERFVQEGGVKTMHFDYRLHQGVATTTNALALLELVGISDRGRATRL